MNKRAANEPAVSILVGVARHWSDAVMLALGLLGLSSCRPTDPRELFNRRAKQFANAAVALDSSALQSLTASDAAVRWALDAARHQSPILSALRGYTYSSISGANADTTAVVFQGGGDCSARPIIVSFAGPPAKSLVVRVESDCVGRPGGPTP